MRAFAAALSVAALLATGGSAAKPAAASTLASVQSHCGAGERVVWSCRFGARLGSVCLGKSSLHYRFGPAGRAAIDVASTPDWRNIHTGNNRSHGGLNQDSIRFTRGMVHYVVHAGETGSLNENPGRRFSGITVLEGAEGEKQLAELACRTGAGFTAGALGALHAAAPRRWQGEETSGSPFDMVY
ncbi:hypothetical protein [Novosphingobium sp.]|uniref:hypothetical protein n=1 Tax=Novosphingobium sp. TaxID=1874826 RepID=UPI00261E5E3E|nr:hypothetical protein [Novosphingobium sp.]